MVNKDRLITELKSENIELKKTIYNIKSLLQKNNNLIDNLPSLLILLDKDGNILLLNEAMAKSLGNTKEDLIGINALKFLPLEVAELRKKMAYKVINTKKPVAELRREFGINCPLATVDATAIAREVLGIPITNTTMLGALVRATGIVKLESLEEPLKQRFGRLAERNVNAMKRAYQETELKE